MKKSTSLFTWIVLTVLGKPAFSAGLQYYEQGTPIIGSATVGQAVVDDASCSYFNPANMAHIYDAELQLGSQVIAHKIRFNANGSNTLIGSNGNNAGKLSPGLGIFGVNSYSDNLTLGFSIASPFASTLQYNDGWLGKYYVQSADLSTYDANFALAYKTNDILSLGMGVFIEYAQLYQRIAIPSNVTVVGGQGDFRLHSYRPGFTLGVLFTPYGESMRIGVSYRSPVKHRPKGDATFMKGSTPFNAELHFPQSVIASLAQDLTDDFTLLAELGWSNWSTFQNTNISIEGVTPPTKRYWKDTYRLGLGGQFTVCENYMLQMGASYDSSPCHDHTRLPDFPADRQLRLGTGLVYTTLECVTFGLQYEFIDYGKAAIHNITQMGTFSGDYARNFANVMSLSVNFKF